LINTKRSREASWFCAVWIIHDWHWHRHAVQTPAQRS